MHTKQPDNDLVESPEIDKTKEICRAILDTPSGTARWVPEPGIEQNLDPKPISIREDYQPSNKLKGKVALVSGGDSGIGRAIALHYAKEGADVIISYLNEHQDAQVTANAIEACQQRCWQQAGDIADPSFCQQLAEQAAKEFGKIDILVNNAAQEHELKDFNAIEAAELENLFRTNVFSSFYMVKACLPYMPAKSSIINTTSVTAHKGTTHLLDDAASKGALTAFTRSLSQYLLEREIRVNAVAPGLVWTPLVAAHFDQESLAKLGKNVPMQRYAQPVEIAPCYVFLACEDASYMTGQVLHPNGGIIVNG